MKVPVLLGFVFVELLSTCLGITTIHHNKPYEATIPVMAANMKKHEQQYQNVTLPASERQKRLLPYMNFYLRQNYNQPYQQVSPPPLPPQHQVPHNNNAQRYRMLVSKQNNPLQPLIRKLNQLANGNIQLPPFREEGGKIKYTPFTETNALPGPFIPMKTNQQYSNTDQPNFSEIYDKLLQLKYAQQQQNQQIQYERQLQKRPIINYVPIKNYEEPPLQKLVQPTKTIIQAYTPTQVDLHQQSLPYQQNYEQTVPPTKPVYHLQRPVQIIEVIDPQIQQQQQLVQELIEKPVILIGEKQAFRQTSPQSMQQQSNAEKQRIFEEQLRIYEDQQNAYRNEQRLLAEQQRKIAEEERKKYILQFQKPLVYGQKILPQQANPQNHQYAIAQDYTQAQKYSLPAQIQPPQAIEEVQQHSYASYDKEPSNIEQNEEFPIPIGQQYQHQYPVIESSDGLGEILRKLQASNTLPQNLTPENIDNSIKTLVRILSILKKHQRLSKKPIIVPDRTEDITNEAGVEYGEPGIGDISDMVVQSFPGDSVEGGTPGKPGIDYPALHNIPKTSFSCKTQRYKGFFGDPDTHCQVWHYCDFNGGQASFLCPNGTIFSQVALTCDWWYNVKCSSTPQLYVLNERLYKYILPFSPKFPEDYSGPLVDRYLALKFQEMEEKMKKHRKKPKESSDQDQRRDEDMEGSDKESQEEDDPDDDDADQLQKHNEESRKQVASISEEIREENNIRRSVS